MLFSALLTSTTSVIEKLHRFILYRHMNDFSGQTLLSSFSSTTQARSKSNSSSFSSSFFHPSWSPWSPLSSIHLTSLICLSSTGCPGLQWRTVLSPWLRCKYLIRTAPHRCTSLAVWSTPPCSLLNCGAAALNVHVPRTLVFLPSSLMSSER